MKVIAATKNKGKIREMQEILAPLDIEIVSETKLFVPVKILSFAIFRQPVTTANSSTELSFNDILSIVFRTSIISV